MVSAKPAFAPKPVPTAVPPRGIWRSSSNPASILAAALRNWVAQPPISWPKVSGTASCRWVRPIFTTSLQAVAFASKLAARSPRAGKSWSLCWRSLAMWIPLGNTSLVLWPLFTWSFGCTQLLLPRGCPASSQARLAITSFRFMFV